MTNKRDTQQTRGNRSMIQREATSHTCVWWSVRQARSRTRRDNLSPRPTDRGGPLTPTGCITPTVIPGRCACSCKIVSATNQAHRARVCCAQRKRQGEADAVQVGGQVCLCLRSCLPTKPAPHSRWMLPKWVGGCTAQWVNHCKLPFHLPGWSHTVREARLQRAAPPC